MISRTIGDVRTVMDLAKLSDAASETIRRDLLELHISSVDSMHLLLFIECSLLLHISLSAAFDENSAVRRHRSHGDCGAAFDVKQEVHQGEISPAVITAET